MDTTVQRWGAVAGVLFGVLLVTGGLLVSAGLSYGAPAGDVARHIQNATGRVGVGNALLLVSAAPLLWFVACLRRRLEADGDDGLLAGLVATAGGVGAAVLLVSATAGLGAVYRAGFDESIGPAGAAAAWDLSGNLMGAALPVAMAVLIAATAVAARRSGWFAPWATWLSWLLVAGLLALPVAWIFGGGGVLWVAAVGLAMTVRGASRAGTTAPTARPRTA